MLFIILIEHVHNGVLIVKQKRYKSSPNLGYRMVYNHCFHGTQVDFFGCFVSNRFISTKRRAQLEAVIDSDRVRPQVEWWLG